MRMPAAGSLFVVERVGDGQEVRFHCVYRWARAGVVER
jgi:hypothetical protein